MKPPFRWAGGKRRLIEHIVPLVQGAKGRYVEPFCGSAAIFFAQERDGDSLLNDISKPIIKTLKGLRQSPSIVKKDFEKLQKYQLEIGHTAFYAYIADVVTNTGGSAASYAAQFIAANQTSFNGLWRVNQSGKYNVPIGYRTVDGKKVPYDLKLIEFKDYARLLKRAQIICEDFRLIKLRRGDIGYCDPPYLDQFSAYASGGFTLNDHLALRDWCMEQVKRGARIVLSGAGNAQTLTVYGKPTIIVNRACTIGASNRKRASEYIYVWE